MNRKQVVALKPGDIVKARRGKSGPFFEFEVMSNQVLEWAGTWIRVRTLAWPSEHRYGWERPPMLVGEKPPHLSNYRPRTEDWETGKEVWIDTRYLRDVEADAERARQLSADREATREAERARREAFGQRQAAWREWLRGQGAAPGDWPAIQQRMRVMVTGDVAERLIGEMAVDAEVVMVFRVDDLGNLVDFPGGPE